MVDGSGIVLKMDCEGSEYDILYALEGFTRISTILLEAHQNIGAAPTGDDSIKKLVQYVTSKGFSVTNSSLEGNAQVIKFVACKNDITVLINGFNRPYFLQEQIASLNAQTVKPDKILVLYTKPKKDFPVPFVDGVDFIVVENDQGLNTRFAVGLIAKTKYLCILDDDILPGKKWLESCLKIIQVENAVISSYGLKFTDGSWNDLSGLKCGDQGIHSDVPIEVDVTGHSWFMKKEWLRYFWMEEPLDWTVSDDIHLSYTMRKYGKLKLLVSPYSDDLEVWGNTMPERGLGMKALHARKSEDIEVWQDPQRSNSWSTVEEIQYLSSNFSAFVEKRRVLLEQYQALLRA